jgi:hypothetical protein
VDRIGGLLYTDFLGCKGRGSMIMSYPLMEKIIEYFWVV